jgi:hypothetical protein
MGNGDEEIMAICYAWSSLARQLKSIYCNPTLRVSARHAHYLTMQVLLMLTSANFDSVRRIGDSIEEFPFSRPKSVVAVPENDNVPTALTALLRVMVLRDSPPYAQRQVQRLTQSIARERTRGAGGDTAEGAAFGVPCATARPTALTCTALCCCLCFGCIAHTTTEELWATGLGAVP